MFNRSKRNLKNKKGFTLIELVVVIAVIGILAAIAIPRVTGVTNNARVEATRQHIATLNSALERYKAETGDDDLNDATDMNGYVAAVAANSGEAAALVQDLIDEGYLSDGIDADLPDGTRTLTVDSNMFATNPALPAQ